MALAVLVPWLWPVPSPSEMPPLGMQILDRQGRLLYQALDPLRGGSRPVNLDEMAPTVVAATIAVEDASFWTNPGLDVLATVRALAQNVRAGDVVAGGSTITQQLARLRYLPPAERAERSLQRKLVEAWLALRLTGALGKQHVLEAYLNSAPFGNLSTGVEAAAWTYFGKPARELSLAESALLAGLPVRVWTTLDADLQSFAERETQRQVDRLAEHDVGNAAVVVLDVATGEMRAMVGGVDYFDPDRPAAQVNMAVTPRQPGSAFKPLLYAAALESGRISLASVLRDERTVFLTRLGERYVPENYDRQFHGQTPLRVALASSFNVPAVQVLNEIGVEPVLILAGELGVGLDPGSDLSLALGAAEVPLLDLTAAYGALASGGLAREPLLISRAEDAQGRSLVDPRPSVARRVLSPETAWLLDDVLSDDAARAPGFGRDSVLHVAGQHVAVKTGTTSDFRDNWTVGFTADVVVGVWVGNPDNRPMRDVSGVSGAAPLWRDVLTATLDASSATAPAPPPDLRQVELCALSEQMADASCAAHRLEWLPASILLQQPDPAPRVRILYPDAGSVLVPDPLVPSAVPIEVEVAPGAGSIDVLVDDRRVGVCASTCVLAAPVTPGTHVIRAAGESVRFEVVPSGRESSL